MGRPLCVLLPIVALLTSSAAVASGTATVLYPGPPMVQVGQPIALMVIVYYSINPTVYGFGPVTFYVDGVAVEQVDAAPTISDPTPVARKTFTNLPGGNHVIVAKYDAGGPAESTSVPYEFLVNWNPSTIAVTTDRDVVMFGETIEVTARVTAAPVPIRYTSAQPTGTVRLIAGDKWFDPVALSNGVAKFSVSGLPVGYDRLHFDYDGDFYYGHSANDYWVEFVGLPIVTATAPHVAEGNSGTKTVALTVSLMPGIAAPASVAYTTVPGTATEGVDYLKASGVLEFAPGQTTQTIDLHIVGDTVHEDDETFSVVFSNPVNALIDVPSVTVVIVDDDPKISRRRAAGH